MAALKNDSIFEKLGWLGEGGGEEIKQGWDGKGCRTIEAINSNPHELLGACVYWCIVCDGFSFIFVFHRLRRKFPPNLNGKFYFFIAISSEIKMKIFR